MNIQSFVIFKNNSVKICSNAFLPKNQFFLALPLEQERRETDEQLCRVENTSRGRSLLFLCAAVSIAGIMGKQVPVYIPENGFIGLNVALTNGRKGSCSTRTTAPLFFKFTK